MEFKYLNKSYDDIFSLTKEISKEEKSISVIKTEEFLSFVEEKDENKANKIRLLLLQSIPDDVLLFKICEVLNPFFPFSFHGFVFEDYEKLGERMLSFSPTPNPVLLMILRYELVSEHMRITLYDQKNKAFFEEVLKIEKESREDLNYAYYCMGYFLSKSKTIIYDSISYKNIYNLTYFLAKKEKDLGALGSYLSFSPLLRAYQRYCDEKEIIDSYLHICEKLDESEKKLKNFLSERKKNN